MIDEKKGTAVLSSQHRLSAEKKSNKIRNELLRRWAHVLPANRTKTIDEAA